jgi:signal transduction histidine kinase
VRSRLTHVFRPTVRLRLTLLYGALFFVAAALMLVLLYALLSREFRPPAELGAGGPPTGQLAGADPNDGNPAPRNRPGGDAVAGNLGPNLSEDDVQRRILEVRRDERAGLLRRVPRLALVALLVTSLAALAIGWVVSGRMLRPLRQITQHARLASETTLADRIALQGPSDELKELADTMDDMLDRLESAFQSQRHFAAQASHELRTPLAIIGAEADVALAAPDVTSRERDLALAVRAAAVRSERLVDGLLALSRSESSMRDRVRLDLADLAGDIAGEQVADADAAGIRLDLTLDQAVVWGDRALLERLIGNLLQNAIRYNHPGGWVRLDVRTEAIDGRAVASVQVENSGPVIPPSGIDALFAPFHRGDSAGRQRMSGHGLGLAIVRSVATAHEGRIEAHPGRDGGLRVRITLPVATPELVLQRRS